MNDTCGWPSAPQSDYLAESFDGAVKLKCTLQKPDRYSFFSPSAAANPSIPKGAGLSYAAASFAQDSTSVDMSNFDRVLAFCEETGIVEVEAGISLGSLYDFLIRRSYYLPVQPGHAAISIGGCIAADVHGKNQFRDGTFMRQVQSMRLFHPYHGIVDLSEVDRPELFQATCGGYGTTGIIVSARLRCVRIPGDAVDLTTQKVNTVQDGIAKLRSLAIDHDFVYSWHDFTRRGSAFGRGYVVAGKFNGQSSDTAALRCNSAAGLRSRGRWPLRIFNSWSMRMLNAQHAYSHAGRTSRISLHEALFPVHRAEHYFRAFGPLGFHEFQALIPHRGFDRYIEGVMAAITECRITITLASAKLFSGFSNLIRFSGEGVCFAINLPRCGSSLKFLDRLDRLLLEVGGRPNVIKDSRLPRQIAEAAYPELPRLRSIIDAWDGERIFRSELSTRLGL